MTPADPSGYYDPSGSQRWRLRAKCSSGHCLRQRGAGGSRLPDMAVTDGAALCRKDRRISDKEEKAVDMEQQPHPAMADGSQVYPASAYPPAGTVAPGVTPAGSQPPPPANQAQLSAQNQLLYEQSQQFQQQLQQQQQRQLQEFWAERVSEIEQATEFKTHTLPLARIKKIMKADEDVRMISADAPLIFAKACEMFVLELTLRSWMHTEENKRRTLQKNDIAAAISRTDVYDFLVDIVPRDEIMKEEGAVLLRAGQAAPAEAYQYYYAQQALASGGAMVYGEQQGQAVNYAYQEPQEQQQQGPPEEQQSFDESG